MAFEALDDETAAFFERGELPTANNDTTTQTTPVAQTDPVVEQTPTATQTQAGVQTQTSADPSTFNIGDEVKWDDAPVSGANPAIVQRLIDTQQAQIEALKKQLDTLSEKSDLSDDKDIDPSVDPLGALMQAQQRIQKQIAELREKGENTARESSNIEKAQLIERHVLSQVEAFTKEHSDYPQAFKFVANARLAQYKTLGYSQQEAHAALDQDNNLIVQRAIQSQKNPAEMIYSLAKQFGYKGVATQTPRDAEKTLENIRKGQESAKTLERAVQPGTVNITASSLKDMSERELDKMVRDDWDAIFGRNKGDI